MKTLRFFATAAAMMACLIACEEPLTPEQGGNEKEPEKTPVTISVSPASVSFEAEGGTFKVAVTTDAADYSVGTAPDWLTVEKSGKEISLTAQPNKVKEARNATIKLTAENATCNIEVSQKLGSPYLGYTMMTEAEFDYSGTMMYMFMKPAEGYDGGQATLTLRDEDGNQLDAWIYTELFGSEEEVEFTLGKYTKGEDTHEQLMARKLTYMAGESVVLTDGDEEEILDYGTSYYDVASEELVNITDGTIEVFEEDGETVVKVDMKGENGEEYKLVYIGEVPVDAEGASYPSSSERIDVAATLFAADGFYNGDMYGNGTSNFQLCLYSGDEENPAITTFEFNTEMVEFSEDMDLTGVYGFPEEGDEEEGIEPIELYSAGSIVPGSMLELMGFTFPMGTYVMYNLGDYVLADMYASLSLEKQEDGTYIMTASIMSSEGDFVMFLEKKIEIVLYDGTAYDEDEDW